MKIYRIICHNSVGFSGMVHGNRIHYLSTVCSLLFSLALFVGLNCIGDVSVLCYLPDKASWQIVQIGLGSVVKWYVSFIPVIDFRAYMNFLQIENFLITKAKVSYVFLKTYSIKICKNSTFCPLIFLLLLIDELLLAHLESAYSLIWGDNEIWGQGGGKPLRLYDK